MSRIATKRAVRSDVRAAFTSIEESIAAGRTNDVLDEIRRTNMSGNPDASDFDLLRHLPAMTQKLAKKPGVEVARGGQASPVR